MPFNKFILTSFACSHRDLDFDIVLHIPIASGELVLSRYSRWYHRTHRRWHHILRANWEYLGT
jgi:hypothetical protein